MYTCTAISFELDEVMHTQCGGSFSVRKWHLPIAVVEDDRRWFIVIDVEEGRGLRKFRSI
jgi:hypothetical protein